MGENQILGQGVRKGLVTEFTPATNRPGECKIGNHYVKFWATTFDPSGTGVKVANPVIAAITRAMTEGREVAVLGQELVERFTGKFGPVEALRFYAEAECEADGDIFSPDWKPEMDRIKAARAAKQQQEAGPPSYEPPADDGWMPPPQEYVASGGGQSEGEAVQPPPVVAQNAPPRHVQPVHAPPHTVSVSVSPSAQESWLSEDYSKPQRAARIVACWAVDHALATPGALPESFFAPEFSLTDRASYLAKVVQELTERIVREG